MNGELPFKRSWVGAFRCPHCGRRSARCLVGAKYSLAPRSYALLYECEACGGRAKLLRPKLFLLIQFLVAVAVFAASFPLALHFAAQWHVVGVLLLSALAVSLLLSHVTYRMLAKYVPVEPAP